MVRDQGVSKTEQEIEMFVKSRQMQKDFMTTDVACRELASIGYNFYAYLKKLQKCSYVSKGLRKTKSGNNVYFIFNSDRDMK